MTRKVDKPIYGLGDEDWNHEREIKDAHSGYVSPDTCYYLSKK
jgi:hypothetical protein